MKHYIAILISALCMVACSRQSGHWDTLIQVDSFIEQHPDSALTVLQRIDAAGLTSNKERAKHALLLSMAMDKNCIDRTDFEVLQPAIDYYETHGTATEKLRTLYYEGRIYQNQQAHDERAMQCFVKALTEGDTSDDILTKARILFTQGRIYSTIFEWDKCLAAYLEAAEYFKRLGKTSSYINCIADAINVYTIIGNPEQAEKYIALAQEDLDGCSTKIKAHFYSSYLTYSVKYRKNEKNIQGVIDSYINLSRASGTDWLSVANAYLETGNTSAAMDALSHHGKVINMSQRLKYQALLGSPVKPCVIPKSSIVCRERNQYLPLL